MRSRNGVPLVPEQSIPAPRTGVHLGRTKTGDVTLRLFRPRGTRIVCFADPLGPQLITLRAAQAGTPTRISTSREAAWAGVVRHGPTVQLAPPEALRTGVAGAALLVDDRPDVARQLGEAGNWQCLLEVHDLTSLGKRIHAEARLAPFAHCDIALFPTLDRDHAEAAGRIFGLGSGAAALTVVPRHAMAVVMHGTVQLLRPEPTAAERQMLGWSGTP
ncbi:hypothetical protein [Nocardioides sp. AE5]|uniref:hypothetical protein n=1 Tax=Nocardioides sp. AE5 TaxID=2962573 RepID=UPI00288286B0|nr:hypothetical protein [Nocardioides sp. AE5]MDT0202162.1 hypothetical protein [Nocardioides sp. AE5]